MGPGVLTRGLLCDRHAFLLVLQNTSWKRGVQTHGQALVVSLKHPLISEAGLQVTVELKNDLAIQGTLHSVDQYLNIKLHNTRVVNEQKYPHMVRHEQQHCATLSAC